MNRTSRYVSFFAAMVGLALLVYLARRAGVTTIVQSIRLFGSGFLVLLFLSGIRQCLRAIAWRQCVDSGAHRQRIWDLFTLRLIGESVTDLSPAGPLLGETVKVWAASKNLPSKFGLSSVVIEGLMYSLGTGMFVLSGFLLLVVSITHTYHLAKAAGCLILSMFVAISFVIVAQRNHLFVGTFDRIRNLHWGQAILGRYSHHIHGWRAGVLDFFRTRRHLLIGILAIEIAVNLISFGETYLILRGATAHASFLNAYLVESANRCAQLVASFVPFGVGVDEGTTAATLHSLGRTLSEGVSVAAIRKLRSLFWDFVGLGLAAHFMTVRRAQRRATSMSNAHSENSTQDLETATAVRVL